MKLYYGTFKLGRPYLMSFETIGETPDAYLYDKDSIEELIGMNIVLYGGSVEKDSPYVYKTKDEALHELLDLCDSNIEQLQGDLQRLVLYRNSILADLVIK